MSSESIKFGPSSMESDKFITVCDNKDGQVIIERNLQNDDWQRTANWSWSRKGLNWGLLILHWLLTESALLVGEVGHCSIGGLRSSKVPFWLIASCFFYATHNWPINYKNIDFWVWGGYLGGYLARCYIEKMHSHETKRSSKRMLEYEGLIKSPGSLFVIGSSKAHSE